VGLQRLEIFEDKKLRVSSKSWFAALLGLYAGKFYK
jgi:hypothetical protein